MYPGTTAATDPDKPAVIVHGTDIVVTYAELEDKANRLARAWADAGLRRGDHVALLTTNDARAFEVYWAAMRSGLYITVVNRHLTATEIAYVVDDCGARVLVVAASLVDVAEKVVPLTPRVELRLSFDGAAGVFAGYEAFRDAASPEPLTDRPRGADMLYSSGTTGRPKGIQPPLPDAQVHEHAEFLIRLAAEFWSVGPDTVYLSPAPIYHAAPLRTAAAVQALGGTVVLMERFDAEEALRAIALHLVTHSQWVPTMFVRMLKLDESVRRAHDLSGLRVALHAGAPCPVDVKRAMIGWWGPILVEYYASTEANGLTMIDSREWLERPGSVGRPVVGELHVCADNGEELPVGEVGTVYFERDALPFRYHGDDDRTAAAQHPRHSTWTTTRDLGRLDEDGYLYLAERQEFVIISGGVNVYPQEIEDALALHPAVHDVAVVGRPDPEMGELVQAYVVAAAGHEPGVALADTLMADLRTRIAGYKVPRGVTFVDSVPRTPTGKLVKGRLAIP